MYDWSQMFIKVGEDMGQTFQVGENAGLIEQAGFVDVVVKKFKLPVGGVDEGQEVEGTWAMESPLLAGRT